MAYYHIVSGLQGKQKSFSMCDNAYQCVYAAVQEHVLLLNSKANLNLHFEYILQVRHLLALHAVCCAHSDLAERAVDGVLISK